MVNAVVEGARRGWPLLLAGLFLAGCQQGGSLGAFDLGGQPQPVEQVNVADIYRFCPQVTLREGTAYFNTYDRGGDGDPARIIYQASIADVTRSCTHNADGSLTMTVAVAGRVVPGPLGRTGNITMPIRIAAARGDQILYSQLHNYQVAVADTAGATQFVFTDPAVTFTVPDGAGVRVFAGYDEGPPRRR